MKRFRVRLVLFLFLVCLPAQFAFAATTFTVNDPGDQGDGNQTTDPGCGTTVGPPGTGGPCTLRAALQQAAFTGSSGAPYTINFSAPFTINVGSVTLDIREQTILDGTSAGKVTLDGGGFSGNLTLSFNSGGSTIKGFVIHNFSSDGIDINTNGNFIQQNFIGTDITGTSAVPNGGSGIQVDSAGNVIGGPTPADFNVISGNAVFGIDMFSVGAFGNVIQFNFIGTDITGQNALGNGDGGISLSSTTSGDVNVPTLVNAIAVNVISGNGTPVGNGISLNNAIGTLITANYIGVALPPGLAAIPNDGEGIVLSDSDANIIGGITIGDRNVVSGNTDDGIQITSGSNNNLINGNFVGLDSIGVSAVPNGRDGIFLNADSNIISGILITAPQHIAGNTRNGITVQSASNNQILHNNIGENLGDTPVANGGDGVQVAGGGTGNLISENDITASGVAINDLAIDLVGTNGPDLAENTDPLDPDTGSNNLQNRPVLLTAVTSGGTTTVSGEIHSLPSTSFTVEFFSNSVCDTSGFGEGEDFDSSQTVGTDGSGNATFSFALSNNLAPGQLVTATATETAANNTSEFSNCVAVLSPGTLQFSAPTYSVGEGGGTATITVTRTGGSDGAVSVDYTTSDGSAVQPGDYTTSASTLNWADGDATSKTFTVPIIQDNIFEGPETVNLTLSNPTGGAALGIPPIAVLTITDDDAQPSITITDVSLPEGNAGTTSFIFTVQLSNPSATPISVDFATADGTATIGNADYAAQSGTVNFAPLQVSNTITILVNGDTTAEADETFFVNLSNPSGATIFDGQGQGTIQNDDVPAIAIDNVSQNEGNAGTTAFTFTVSLSAPSLSIVTVDFATGDGTATTADSDYVANSNTVTFNPSEVSKPVTILVNGDTKLEPNETFFVNLSNATNATIFDNQGQGTIQNDDTQPAISISDVTQTEGASGTTAFGFTVTLTNASSQTITVDFATADDTATTADPDYAANSGTITFNPGEVSKPLTVLVNGDATVEPDETFFVNLTNPTNATIADSQGLGTIINDDSSLPTFTINNVSQVEGNAGTTTFTFTVTLSPTTDTVTSVTATTADGTATTADNDYVFNTQTLNFPAFTATQQFSVTVNGDTKLEPDETFAVNLSGNSAGTSIAGSGTGTIQNDDATPTISINDVSAAEGNAGTTPFTFTVTLSNASSLPISVDFTTADGSATIANGDYALSSGTLNFAPGVLTQPITVNVNGDTTPEPNEAFNVNLSNPTNSSINDGQGLGTIVDDDVALLPTLLIDDVSHNEGNAGTTTYTFTVTLSAISASTVTVDAGTQDGSATIANNDYNANSQTLTFAPGVTSQPFTVTVNGDVTVEPDENFFVNLTNPSNALLAKGQGTGTVVNDDAAALSTLSIDNVSQVEGNAGTTTYTFTVTLAPASASTVTVDVATADGTATVANNDYVANSQTLTFSPGITTQTFSVTVNGDLAIEGDETFFVNLTNATNATIVDNQGLGTIVNDDAASPTLSINNVTLAEGNAGTTAFTFTVTLSPTTQSIVTVDVATADGTATIANSDYAANSQTLTFGSGVSTQSFTVLVNGDATVEPNETFFVNLTNPTNAAIGVNQGTGTIVNDDVAPQVPTADVSVVKTAVEGTNQVTYTISVNNAGPDPATNVVVTDVLPAGSSFSSAITSAGTCVGTATVTCTIPVLAASGSETITIVVTSGTPGTLTNTATVTATEDDPNLANNTSTVAADIPTLSMWMLIALAAALTAFAALKLRT